MKSLWAYIEGMVDLSLPFTATDSSDLAVNRFGVLVLFEAHLLLLYVLVLPNSSTHVATLFWCPMKSLWAYIEGMVDLCLPFTAIDSSDLAVTRFGILVLFEARLLLLHVLVLPNSSTHVATLFWCPMKSLWAYIEGMVDLSLPFTA